MRISYLELEGFRNHLATKVHFEPGANLFLGLNGQGKTNLVESLYFLSFGKSHRTSNLQVLINKESDSAVIRAELLHKSRTLLAEVLLKKSGGNQYRVNKNKASAKDIQRNLPVVMFSPEDLDIVRGDPGVRRKFIDDYLVTRYPGSQQTIREYDRALRQRNSLLKTIRDTPASANTDQLSLWDDMLADLGSQIIFHRRQTIYDLKDLIASEYQYLTTPDSSATVSIRESLYDKNVSRETIDVDIEFYKNVSRETIREDFSKAIAESRRDDILKTQTSIGPHRDELVFMLNGFAVKGYASHGETWSFVLAVRLASAALVAAESFIGDPLLILDDVFAELDGERQERLYEKVRNFEQVLITAASSKDLPSLEHMNILDVESGRVSRRGGARDDLTSS